MQTCSEYLQCKRVSQCKRAAQCRVQHLHLLKEKKKTLKKEKYMVTVESGACRQAHVPL